MDNLNDIDSQLANFLIQQETVDYNNLDSHTAIEPKAKLSLKNAYMKDIATVDSGDCFILGYN